MVSIRRQRLIKLYGRSPFLDGLSSYNNGQYTGSWVQNARFGMHPSPSTDVEQPNEENTKSEEPEPSTVNESSSSNKQPVPHPEFKRRKRHRRKIIENQEACIMRGVYFKNMKWQAAIKVDKKQIHLGTVSSQEEAARLYDRAAFMCGREPNFELTVKEKDELSKLSWDDFLAMTRSAINNKIKFSVRNLQRQMVHLRMKDKHYDTTISSFKFTINIWQIGDICHVLRKPEEGDFKNEV
ncbi:ethylene-responsive transcription factor-like protein At4g13040 isoform X2 [Helianthus annuus]|uniref:ethylene-responsive transcription factor-like protein At4g13040 isoform X2 n=1 Tax=Helianthus annuus TaxID=4232 RepID=UPI000B8F8F6C|nr:ethylene-responsive transcription factor-like protein At4g13040 isoform X2 [Helianthus annuus]